MSMYRPNRSQSVAMNKSKIRFSNPDIESKYKKKV